MCKGRAVSVTNLILLRGCAYEDRERFGCLLVLESILTLQKKESGLCFQEEALDLLFLLLNGPKISEIFFCGYKIRECALPVDYNDDETMTIFRGSDFILESLADCVSSRPQLEQLALKSLRSTSYPMERVSLC